MQKQTSFSFKLDKAQQKRLIKHLQKGNYKPREVPHTQIAVTGANCQIALYTSGKCVVQGKEAEEWVKFVLEPKVLQEIITGYENVFNPEFLEPHMGVDESGKGDFFGPLVIASAYVDEDMVKSLKDLGVRDSKNISSDIKLSTMARDLRKTLRGNFSIVTIGPSSYNQLYEKMGSVNKILAWGHARAIENLLERIPSCPRAVADQFGPKRQIKTALMKNGRNIELVQRTKAESDPAVAAASILARAQFLFSLNKIQKQYKQNIYKGASEKVKEAAVELVQKEGPEVLLNVAKCHFKTSKQVLKMAGHSGEEIV